MPVARVQAGGRCYASRGHRRAAEHRRPAAGPQEVPVRTWKKSGPPGSPRSERPHRTPTPCVIQCKPLTMLLNFDLTPKLVVGQVSGHTGSRVTPSTPS